MNQYEYIDILRDTLSAELPESKVKEHIQYYNGYIEENTRNNKGWEDILEELGDPRLIAKTIIDTYKLSKDYINNGGSNGNSNYYEDNKESYQNQESNNSKRSPFAVPWYTRVIGILITVVVLFAVIILGTLAIRLIFTIGLPILIIYIIIKLLQNIFRSRY